MTEDEKTEFILWWIEAGWRWDREDAPPLPESIVQYYERGREALAKIMDPIKARYPRAYLVPQLRTDFTDTFEARQYCTGADLAREVVDATWSRWAGRQRDRMAMWAAAMHYAVHKTEN